MCKVWDWGRAGRHAVAAFCNAGGAGAGARALRRLLRPAQDGDTLNNYVEVAGEPGAAAARTRRRSEEAPLTGDERARLDRHFGVHG